MRARSRIRPTALVLLGLATLLAPGCRNCDLVESELRARECELRDTRAELGRCEACNEGLLREVMALRQGGANKPSPELASQTFALKQVALGRGTGGYDDDGVPGDEALEVFLEPRDADNHTIKVPGAVHIEAVEISPEGIKTPLSAWDVTPEQLRRTWRSGLMSTGYDLILPWKEWPTSEKLRVTVRFTLLDGRAFEADKDVTLRLSGPVPRKSPVIHPLPEAAAAPIPKAPEAPMPKAPTAPMPKASEAPMPKAPEAPMPKAPAAPMPKAPEGPLPLPRRVDDKLPVASRPSLGGPISRPARTNNWVLKPIEPRPDALIQAVELQKPQPLQPKLIDWANP